MFFRQPSDHTHICILKLLFLYIYHACEMDNTMNFENLDVWKRSARLSADIYKFTIDLNDFGFRNQLTRSGLSVPSNIADS